MSSYTRKYTQLFIRAMVRPEGYLVATFAGLILIGACLLALPAAHASPEPHPYAHRLVNAMFTSTSAVCVTGLTVLDTEHDYSRFGQLVILVLIQCGGLGIMTFASFAAQLLGQKISFRSQAALHDVFYQQTAAGQFRRHLRWLVILTLSIESVGAVLLFRALPADFPRDQALFTAVFHAVSAFCNAGFSTFSDSLVGMSGQVPFMAVIVMLIVLGGLGYSVLFELLRRAGDRVTRRRNFAPWSLNTRMVLTTSGLLIVWGMLFLYLAGFRGQTTGVGPRVGHAFFQSVTARTAGFNTLDIAALPTCALLMLIVLMFIGGSPGSCAGGIKTTSLAIWVARMRARLRHREDVTVAGRRIPVDLVRRTGLLIGVAVVFNLLGILVLSISEMNTATGHAPLSDILFEQISAFGTVGLSTGLTPVLSLAGKCWIILSMFVGRLGPLTVAFLVLEHKPDTVRLPEERLMVG
ncbi:MAG: ATPase [Phycisphaerales bacterium]|nr:ATPase [Phycisphaerales bacterium]